MAVTLESLEKEVARLPQAQLKKFRTWYEKFDSDNWDEQIEKDVNSGKLDSLAETALAEHIAGNSEQL